MAADNSTIQTSAPPSSAMSDTRVEVALQCRGDGAYEAGTPTSGRASETRREARILLRGSHFTHSPPTRTCAYRISTYHFHVNARIALRALHFASRFARHFAVRALLRLLHADTRFRQPPGASRSYLSPNFFVMHDGTSSSSPPTFIHSNWCMFRCCAVFLPKFARS